MHSCFQAQIQQHHETVYMTVAVRSIARTTVMVFKIFVCRLASVTCVSISLIARLSLFDRWTNGIGEDWAALSTADVGITWNSSLSPGAYEVAHTK